MSRSMRDGQHDFDFELGTWATYLRRLKAPLTGSTDWVEYKGTSVVRPIWGGRANLVELDVAGTAGRIEGLNLRLYRPQSGQWSLTFASSATGLLATSAIGAFEDGRGAFYSEEDLDGRAILARFVILDITATSCRFEQSFSDDRGSTWEPNWVALDTRIGA